VSDPWNGHAVEPFNIWSTHQNRVSMQEGWILTNDSSGRVTIARLDDPASVPELNYTEPKFKDDQEAYEFVGKLCKMGSHLHFVAIWLQGYKTNDILECSPR